jgi:hypothetical protein
MVSDTEIDMALKKYNRLVELLIRSKALPLGDIGRFELSSEYVRLRRELNDFTKRWRGMKSDVA